MTRMRRPDNDDDDTDRYKVDDTDRYKDDDTNRYNDEDDLPPSHVSLILYSPVSAALSAFFTVSTWSMVMIIMIFILIMIVDKEQ